MARKTIFRSIFIIAVFVVFAPNEARSQFVNVYHVNTGGDGVVVGACANPPGRVRHDGLSSIERDVVFATLNRRNTGPTIRSKW